MPEITALVRVSLARHRWLLLGMMIVVAIGLSVSLFWRLLFPGELGDRVTAFAFFLSLLPAGIAAIILFDYGLDQDLNLPDSGCSHWILRMPVRSWKIAIVPIILKTAWVTLLWVIMVLAAPWQGTPRVPLILPCVMFSSITIWIMVLSWRPFRSPLTRFVAMAIAAPILYVALVGAIASPGIQRPEYRTVAIVASAVGGVVLYIGGVWCLIRSTHLARTNPGGIVPASEWTRRSSIATPKRLQTGPDLPIRIHQSQARALFHHDFLLSYRWIRNLYLFFVIPSILGFIFLVPVNHVAVVGLFIVFGYFSGIAASRIFNSPESPNELPVYLAASPLSTKTLAWTRQLFPLAVVTMTYLGILVVIAGWVCWESNREAWMRWAESQAMFLESDSGIIVASPIPIGIRLSVALVLGLGILVLGQIAAFWWVGLTGRQWVSLLAAIVAGLAFLIPLSIVITWFLQQTDWESTRASALGYLSWLPWLVGAAILAKAVVAMLVSAASLRQNLLSRSEVARGILVWAGATIGLGVGFYLLLPYQQATFMWCLAITALLIPLGRILGMPLALAWNRHR